MLSLQLFNPVLAKSRFGGLFFESNRTMQIRFTLLFLILLAGIGLSAQRIIPIYADTRGDDSLAKLATILKEQLKRSSGDSFELRPAADYNGTGFFLATAAATAGKAKPPVLLGQSGAEAYWISANTLTAQIVGNTHMGVGHGIFAYLDFIGYRYYFANPAWHVIPANPVLFKNWAVVSAPSFFHRRIWYGYGTNSKIADADYNFWVLANRLGGTINAYFGHSYGNIIAYNRDTFLLHPEWFYPVMKKGTLPADDPKFDMSREDLIQFLIRNTEREIEKSMREKTERYKMISMAPSDGPGTCNTPACQQLGTITDRVYYIVNRVAKAIRAKYPYTLIGCMAYGEYSPPPTKKVEPNVFVGITTAFNNSKYTIDQLIDKWREAGAMLGIYDYFSWYAWDFDIPGQSLASRSRQMIASIRKYYNRNVKAYEGESSIGWISKGLGYYLAARQMWDVKADPETARQEFFKRCFGKAAEVMTRLWEEWESYSFTLVREGDLARWIDYSNEAARLETGTAVGQRLFQIRSYLHYLYLYRQYQLSKTEANLLAILSYGYRKLDDGSVSGYPAVFVLGGQSGIPGMGLEENAKWKTDRRQVTEAELNQWIAADRSRLKISQPVATIAPATSFRNVTGLQRFSKLIADSANRDAAYWMTNEWVIRIRSKGAANYLDFTGDFIGDSTNKKKYRITVYPYAADGKPDESKPLFSYIYDKKQVKERISLARLPAGTYTLIIEDPVKIFRMNFSPVIDHSMAMRPDRPVNVTGVYYGFLYVPEGTKRFNIVKQIVLHLVTPTGRQLNFTDNKEEDIQVEVKDGETGLWLVKPLNGKLYVEGIPPFFSTSAARMLIPAQVR